MPRVVLAVVTYGHHATLPATLDALDALHYPAEQRDVVLVDNGDGACAAIANQRGVRAILPGRNLGFAAGSNAAVDAGDAELVVLINPDLRPRPDFLEALIAPLAGDAVGAVGAKLLYEDGRTIQHAGGWLEQPRMTAQHTGWGEPDDGRWDQARDVEFVTGAALAVRREVWDRLGGLDAAFAPAYYEDVDLCLRLQSQGMQVRYEPRATAIHLESAALGRATAAYHRLYHRNRLRLVWKHRPDDRLVRFWLPAELAYLRDAFDDGEIAALMDAYLWWQAEFLEGGGNTGDGGDTGDAGDAGDAGRDMSTAAHGRRRVQGDGETQVEDGGPSLSQFSILNSQFAWLLEEMQRKQAAAPARFRSRLPFVARLRELLSRLVVVDYLRPLTQQQNDFNASTAELLTALVERSERQRRTADAAIACQAMVLAKLTRLPPNPSIPSIPSIPVNPVDPVDSRG